MDDAAEGAKAGYDGAGGGGCGGEGGCSNGGGANKGDTYVFVGVTLGVAYVYMRARAPSFARRAASEQDDIIPKTENKKKDANAITSNAAPSEKGVLPGPIPNGLGSPSSSNI